MKRFFNYIGNLLNDNKYYKNDYKAFYLHAYHLYPSMYRVLECGPI